MNMNMKFRDDGRVWLDDQICDMADMLLNVQGISFYYLKKCDHSWIYRIGDYDMKNALLQMTELQIRIIEALVFDNKTVTDICRELDLTMTEIRSELRAMRKLLRAAM